MHLYIVYITFHYLLISPAKKVSSLSSAASKSYSARTFLPSEVVLELAATEFTLGYKLELFLEAGELCDEVFWVWVLLSCKERCIAVKKI